MAGHPNTFILLGHGVENVIEFAKRKEIPEGYTLVTLAECGIVTRENDVLPLVEAFTQGKNGDILANPANNKKKIQKIINNKDIHIYTEGMLYPELKLQMFLDFNEIECNGKVEQGKFIMKSGVYQFPLDRDSFTIGANGHTFCRDCFKKIDEYKGMNQKLPDNYDVRDMFAGSIIPRQADVSEILSTNKSVKKLKKQLSFSLEELFTAAGPGIYYHVVCRSVDKVKEPKNYVNNTLQVTEKNALYTNYKPYFNNDWHGHIPELLGLLRRDLESPNISKWQKNNIRDLISDYEKLIVIPKLRRNSVYQQEQYRPSMFKSLKRFFSCNPFGCLLKGTTRKSAKKSSNKSSTIKTEKQDEAAGTGLNPP